MTKLRKKNKYEEYINDRLSNIEYDLIGCCKFYNKYWWKWSWVNYDIPCPECNKIL